MKTFLIVCWFVMAALCMFDVYSTYVILNNGGTEINPFMNWIMKHIGVANALIFTKVPVLILLAIGINKFKSSALSIKEKYVLVSVFVISITSYTIVMYNFNFQFL
jgi:hypothetical protein